MEKKTYKPTKQKTHKPQKPKPPPKQTHKDRKIHQQEGYRDSTEELTSRILLPIADAQERKGPAVGRKGDGGLIIKHTASLRMPGKTI